MKSKVLHLIQKLLIALLGAGIGVALTFAAVSLVKLANPDVTIPLVQLVLFCIGLALLLALVMWLLSERILSALTGLTNALMNKLDSMPVTSLVPAIAGLVVGLVIAALLCGILHFMGSSIFTTAFSALLYLTLGVFGYTIGYRRAEDLNKALQQHLAPKGRRFHRKSGSRRLRAAAPGKLLDLSALSDGRLTGICREGFLEGDLIAADFMVEELRRLSASGDVSKRVRGERGLSLLEQLKGDPSVHLRVIATPPEPDDPDVRLLRLARNKGYSLVTCDQSLARSAAVSDIRVLNINRLNEALRLSLSAGDIIELTLVKEGREAHQGVGYLPDGTMVVCENAAPLVGQTVNVTVTSVLQTSAGRMVFAKLAESES
ncbi:MAG: hypothetical protein IKP40_00855 [Clostridia bacterium]|nr:hypothetical protein [Clostridia bacterium]